MAKIRADIYKLDNDAIEEDTSIEEHIKEIMYKHTERGNMRYISIDTLPTLQDQYNLNFKLFISEKRAKIPDWLEFLSNFITEDEKHKIEDLRSLNPSFILFIYSSSDIYAVTKGKGSTVIGNYILQNFGLEILERLIDKDKSDLRQSDEREVFGSVLAQSRLFKPDHKLNDNLDFNKFYKKVSAFIDKEKLEDTLGIKTDKKSLIISGANSLKIRTKVDVHELLDRVLKIDTLLSSPPPPNNRINSFRMVSVRELRRPHSTGCFKDHLQNNLLSETYDLYIDPEIEEVEIYHPDIFQYQNASEVSFYFTDPETAESKEISLGTDGRITLETVLSELEVHPQDKEEFIEVMKYTRGYFSYDDEQSTLSYEVPLHDWLMGEVDVSGNKFFKFDNLWYRYEESFTESIDTSINYLLGKIDENKELPIWNYSLCKERAYNKSFKDEEGNYIVCDTALLNGIEICDFFDIDEETSTATLYHVKNGWGQSIRVVCNQILNGARQFMSIRSTSNEEAKESYYQQIKNKNYSKTEDNLEYSDIQALFNCKNFQYHLVFGSNSPLGRDNQIKNSRSYIAKLSILSCENELRSTHSMALQISKVRTT